MSLEDIIRRALASKVPARNQESRRLEDDILGWVKTLFPRRARKPFSQEQKDFWEWAAGIEVEQYTQPYFPCWPRGHAKSSSAEMLTVYLGATRKRNVCLYVCANQDRANEHVRNIAALLETPEVEEYYPEMAAPKVGKHGNQQGWNVQEFICQGGFACRGIGLNAAARGVRFDDMRPDIIILDDIDEISDSPTLIAKKLRILTRSILPARGDYPVIVFAQNLIHAGSIAHQVMYRSTDMLITCNRRGPIKAFTDLEVIDDPEDDGYPKRKIIVGGVPTWDGFDAEAAQAEMDDIGYDAFMAECQQEVNTIPLGAIYPEYDEVYHVITESEMWEYYGARCGIKTFHIPHVWRLARGQDWGTTKAHPTVTHWMARPSEDRELDFDPLMDSLFLYREMVRPTPEFPELGENGKPVINPVTIKKKILELERANGETARMDVGVMSHEQNTVRAVYLQEGGPAITMDPAGSGRIGGIDVMKTYLEIDFTKEHPFRRYPMDWWEIGKRGKPIMGRPRFYIVVKDGEGELFTEEKRLMVKPPRGESGMIRTRWEFPKYHWIKTLNDEERQLPYAMDNDAMDALRYIADLFGPLAKKLSRSDKVAKKMEEKYPHLTPESIGRMPNPEHQAAAIMTRDMYMGEVSREIEERGRPQANFRLRAYNARRRREQWDSGNRF